jgi:hypothetical protein
MQETTTTLPTETQKRITLATLKSFIRKNANFLYIKSKSRFDGMTDCVQEVQDQFTSILAENAIGLKGAYLVGGSRNRFWNFENDNFVGIEISNCCGRSIIAIKK